MTRCDSPACFCSWPPLRRVPSTDQRYTVAQLADIEVDALGAHAVRARWAGALFFRYDYLEART